MMKTPHFLKPSTEDQRANQSQKKLIYEERKDEPSSSSDFSNIYNNPYASLSIQQQRSRLPIFKVLFLNNLNLCLKQ